MNLRKGGWHNAQILISFTRSLIRAQRNVR
ncbi:unnamed protein product [Chondrus crispus]|uniref:Uncharacterized protein n=1 Tax=Chondrus crispus TaxID=2769 RepID=R7Q9P9_CHOCR|nr:unnamed protein product [Chondrus crispus]CDF34205.1 unnamed protein product [Chondrus crispus]|eukprot:XP_005714024.1 unnamed protein product [Chondrus crispus]